MYQDTIYWLARITKFNLIDRKAGILVEANSELGCKDSIQASINSQSIITNIQLKVQGCILFQASVNALCLAIENKSRLEGLEIINNFLNMIECKDFDSDLLSDYLKLFEKFKLVLSRKNCLTIGAIELKRALKAN